MQVRYSMHLKWAHHVMIQLVNNKSWTNLTRECTISINRSTGWCDEIYLNEKWANTNTSPVSPIAYTRYPRRLQSKQCTTWMRRTPIRSVLARLPRIHQSKQYVHNGAMPIIATRTRFSQRFYTPNFGSKNTIFVVFFFVVVSAFTCGTDTCTCIYS